MKKSRRNRNRPGSDRTSAAEARELDPRADGDPQLSAALQSFDALTVGGKLHFLAVVLRDEIDRKAAERVPTIEVSPDLPAPESALPTLPTLPSSPADGATILAAASNAVPEQWRAAPPATLPPPAAVLAKRRIVESDESAHYAPRNFPLPVRMSEARALGAAAGRPPSSTASILMTMACSFVLTLGVMLWHRQSDASASQNPPSPALGGPLEAAPPPATSPAPMPTERLPVPPPRRAPQQAPSRPQSFASSEALRDHAEPANDLPVELSFRRRPIRNEEEHGGRFGWQLTGRIHNLSDEELAVDVSVEGEQGPTYAQVMIDPEGDAEFGSNDGLEIHPNDRITLHAAPYSDVVSQVR